jgi:uncharacterized protein YecE (DUF72 family)
VTSERISVGTVGYPIAVDRVHAAVDAVELTDGRHVPPRGKAARRLRERAPESLTFTVQLPAALSLSAAELPDIELGGDRSRFGGFQRSEENLVLWRRGLEFAEQVRAEALVLVTPGSFTPAPGNLNRMEEFLVEADRGGLPLVWEPHGPWEHEHAERFARDNGLVLAVDPLRDEPAEGRLAYLRLGPFAAMGSRIGVYDLERIAEAASRFERALCLFDTPRAVDDARNLKQLLCAEPVE